MYEETHLERTDGVGLSCAQPLDASLGLALADT